jgi:hypothetical protein
VQPIAACFLNVSLFKKDTLYGYNVLQTYVVGGEINSGFIGDNQSLAGSRKSLNQLHGQPVVMMPHPSATGGHLGGPGFPPPPPPFMQV